MSGDDQSWRDQARCTGEPIHVFFPGDENGQHADYTLAKAICRLCPAKEPCLEFALIGEHGAFGCWGGTTPRERRVIRRRRRLGDVIAFDITKQ